MSRWIALIAVVLCFTSSGGAAAERPNLLVVVTDDQGRWAVGAYGNKEVHTPHMDSLARDGALFVNAFTNTPVCSPSRATWLSGLYPTQVGITDWIAPQESEAGLGLAAQTWPQVLQKAGYRTALFGKWHLGGEPQFHPTRLGFDVFQGITGGGASPMNPTMEIDGKTAQVPGYFEDIIADHAVRFIESNKGGDRPWAVCFHTRAPHLAYKPVPPEDAAHYKDLDPTIPDLPALDKDEVKASTRDYYASISSVDRNLGRLLETLEKTGQAKNTLVIFASDHGYNEGRHYVKTKGNGTWIAGGVNGPKRPNMWDTSVRIPLLVRWPGVTKPGTVIEQPISNVDMFRTILGALDVDVPANAKALGHDLSPLLRGRKVDAPDVVYGQYDLHNSGLAYMRMIRTPRYKLVRHFHANSMDELYDLKSDPDEERNLMNRTARRGKQKAKAGEDISEVHAQLEAQLLEWMKSINDPLLKDEY